VKKYSSSTTSSQVARALGQCKGFASLGGGSVQLLVVSGAMQKVTAALDCFPTGCRPACGRPVPPARRELGAASGGGAAAIAPCAPGGPASGRLPAAEGTREGTAWPHAHVVGLGVNERVGARVLGAARSASAWRGAAHATARPGRQGAAAAEVAGERWWGLARGGGLRRWAVGELGRALLWWGRQVRAELGRLDCARKFWARCRLRVIWLLLSATAGPAALPGSNSL